jgi:hypothetical protein
VAQRVAGGLGFQPAGYDPIGYQSLGYRLKKRLLGRPLPTSRLVHERLRKLVALAVFSSDAISSTAYGTEQIMLILIAGGADTLSEPRLSAEMLHRRCSPARADSKCRPALFCLKRYIAREVYNARPFQAIA